MNVAIYARVSSEMQAEHGRSIETQIEACHRKAKDMGAFVVKEYIDDGYSGGYLERPALDQLRDAIADGLYEAVIIYDADRLARKLINQLILTEEFEKHKCKVIYVLGEVADTPEGAMTLQMKGVFAEYERAKIRERTMRGKRAKLRAGKAIEDSHIYGYDFDHETSQYVINPAEAEVIKKIYHLYVEERVGGCEVVAKMLDEEGIPTATGNGHWNLSVVRDIIHRPHYTGHYYANTQYHVVTPNSDKKFPRPREEWIPMTCPAIISEEMHKKALAIKDTKRTFKRWKPSANPGLLQGLAYCKCGGHIKIHTNTKHKYYMCPNTAPRNGGTCSARYLKINLTDEIFWRTLTGICKSTKSLSAYIKKKAPHKAEPKNKKRKLTDRLKKIETERQAIMSWFSKSLLSQSDATDKLAKLKDEEIKLQNELAQINNDSGQTAQNRLEPADICKAIQECSPTTEARRKAILETIERVNIIRVDNNFGHKYELDIEIFFK